MLDLIPKYKAIYIIITIIVLVLGIFLFINYYPSTRQNNARTQNTTAIEDQRSDGLKADFTQNFKFEKKNINPCLADELKLKPVPTNRIWSSIPFNCKIQGLFTFPLGFQTNNGKLIVGVPTLGVSDKAIISNINQAKLELTPTKSIAKVVVADYSDLSIKTNFLDSSGNLIFTGTFTQGSPYVFFENINEPMTIISQGLNRKDGNSLIFEQQENPGGLAVFTKTDVNSKEANEVVLDTKNNAKFSIGYFESKDNYSNLEKYSQNFIQSVWASYNLTGGEAITSYNFKFTQDSINQQTYFGLLPHQYLNTKPKYEFKALTVRGKQLVIPIENQTEVRTPRESILEELPIDKISDADKKLLIATLKTDAKNVQTTTNTSYFGGKNVAKIARLIQIADQLDQQETKSSLITILRPEMANWFTYKENETNKFFSYDVTLGGLIGNQSEFDSANYNDHHFQYGHFIFASSVLGKYDPDFVTKYGKVVELIIKDIAYSSTIDDSSLFPRFRVFDFFEGHSWASGYAPFVDGNNQESTSEAINAWYSIWLWGKVTNNAELQKTGSYLYTMEINSANEYWLNRPSGESVFPKEYKQDMVSLLWGGKAEFATWFSGQPLDIYGIQYLPFTPGSAYLYDKEAITRDSKRLSISIEKNEGKLIDLTVMYLATLQGKKVLPEETLNKLPIDDGNTRTNLLHWIFFWDKVNSFDSNKSADSSNYQITYKDKSKQTIGQ